MQNLKINEGTVTVKLLTVDGKKMTKAFFNQIKQKRPVDIEFKFIGTSFFGYVIDKGKWLIFIKDENIYRYNLPSAGHIFALLPEFDKYKYNYYLLKEMGIIKKVKDFLGLHQNDNESFDDYSIRLKQALLNLKQLHETIEPHQLFIAI